MAARGTWDRLGRPNGTLELREEVRRAIARYYAGEGDAPSVTRPDADEAEDDSEQVISIGTGADALAAAPIRLVNQILEQAIAQRVSDIHVEPHDKRVLVRFRIDGVMYDWQNMRHEHHPTMLSRIKVLAHMNIAERRLPLDGRFTVKMPQQQYDVRVSTVPGVYGEKAVLRLLPKGSRGLELEELGLTDENVRLFEEMVRRPYGMVLVTGPTGSGKTTTLYAALRKIDCVAKNAITIEDPVEYRLPGIYQLQTNQKIDFTFAKALRSVLRSDPDVVMVGEIRDVETAAISMRAALTGHFVLSTLHTNDAPSTITRLTEMGVEPFVIASGISAILAQRLARKLCEHCREPYAPSADELEKVGLDGTVTQLWRPGSCERCTRGYRGRIGIFQLLLMTDEVRRLTAREASAHEIEAAAAEAGMRTLWEDGVDKVLSGLTTVDELRRTLF